MIDIKELRDHPEVFRASQKARGEDDGVVDAILEADLRRRSSLTEFEQLRASQKSLSKDVSTATGEDRDRLLAQTKAIAARVKELAATSAAEQDTLDSLMMTVGNVIIDGVPSGGEEDFALLETVGTPRDFAAEGFAPRDHLALGEILGALDIARGSKVGGSRFYYLRGQGVRLENAVMSLCMQVAREEGHVPLSVPNLVKEPSMRGAGYLDSHADEVYRLEADDLYLIGTSEVAIAAFHSDEILDLSDGPLRYAAASTCYRREAGSHGKDTRGIFRTHQFQKTEMFVFCRPEDALAEHERLLRIERRILDAVEVPYRVIDVAAGDLGGPAARKFDCEAWIPTQEKYRELTSTSNCTTFQARRLNIRERESGGDSRGGTRSVATLNGTMATTRWLVAILENHQLADGSVRVPAALQPFLGQTTLVPGGI
ncbi:serine--tRNA ligase [Lapillicoccus sp.]|uniref:serine--tRNA ligase n=1 Tax=Lapillicoccus sp. TaxID=1909287 RepID=UPI0025D5AD76|nr:serine--tRNA ligase [Lapillicoccus sp.]